jgi:hypothetical protein
MPHQNLSSELLLSGSILLTAIGIFVIMVISAVVSLRSSHKREAESRQEKAKDRL